MNSKNWYKKHLVQIKKKAGARYTPELNVNLPISEIFDGISRTEKFYATIRENYGELLRQFKYITSKYEKDELQKNYDQIKKEIDVLFKLIENIKIYNTNKIPWGKIHKETKILLDILREFASKLREEKDQVQNIQITARKDGSYQQSPSEKLNSDIHDIYKTQESIRYFEELSSSTKAQLSNHPFLLLNGSAGTGKTHLLCDVLENRINSTSNILPTILLFGDFFSNESDFWSQTLEQLGIINTIKTKDDILKKLDDFGKNARCRSLLIVDALNENISRAPAFWKNNLHHIVKEIKKYPNIAFIVSVRSGFENEVLTEEQKTIFINEQHNGFHFKEWEAVNKFFKAFSLPLPEIPLLMPEFQNPLFLLLFCKAFRKKKNKKKKQIFRGQEGATYIFESFTLNATGNIAKEFKIRKNRFKSAAYRLWNEVIKEIASEMVSQNDDRITEKKLCEIIQKTYPQVDLGKFVQALESNMLIIKVPRYVKGKRDGGFDIRFPFQKFSDHLIGRYIFKKYEEEFGIANKKLETAKRFFSKRRKLGKFLSKSWNRGIIETLSIQCPERLKGIEFVEVAPYLIKDNYIADVAEEAFVESIVWRNPEAFSKYNRNTLKIINQNIIKTESGHNQLLNAFLSVAPIPNHPFNAKFLHQHLLKFSMPKRDSWWSTFLHYQYGEQGAVDRLLKWAWSDRDKSYLSDESIFLTCIVLSWFLTTPNRFVRDKATKGLVCLLQDRIHLIPKLLEAFKNVNDLYVTERLFSVAYGCVLINQKDLKNLEVLTKWIYEKIFQHNKPPVHILLRDYARGIIDVALSRGIYLEIDENNINPPYKSVWPKKIPSEKELKKKYYPEDFSKEKTKDRGFLGIWSSIMHNFGTLGDFGNYVINSHLSPWTGKRIGESVFDREKIFNDFINYLSSKQKTLWEETDPIIYEENRDKKIINMPKILLSFKVAKGRKSEKELKIAIQNFKKSLNLEQKKVFNNEIEPFLDHNQNIYDSAKNFDARLAQRWIFNRVIKLGYNPEIHGKFDKFINYNRLDNSSHKAERIGKKYQWIAYHEFMALVSDHFEFKGDSSYCNNEKNYKGPWHPYIRDIDPSFILQNDSHIKNSVKFSEWEKSHGKYDAWKKSKSDINWLKIYDDLPSPVNIIKIIDDNKRGWLMLEGFIKWEEKTPPEYKKYDIPIREVWNMIKSYIVKKKDAKKFYIWAKKQDFMGRWMPESHVFYEIFLGEHPNSLAFDGIRDDYNVWIKPGWENSELSIAVVVTDDSYLNEFTLDCSHSGSVSVKLPCKWLVNKMNLYHKYLDGRFYDKNENLITICTSIIEENFLSALLIDKQAFFEFLNKNDYVIFWTLLGEKQLIGGSYSREDFVGRLEISGTYTLGDKGKIYGENHSKFKK